MPCQVFPSHVLRLLNSPGQRLVPCLREKKGEKATEETCPSKHRHGQPGEGGKQSQLGDVRGEDGAQPAHHGAHPHTEASHPGGEQFPRVEIGRPEAGCGSELAQQKENSGDISVGDKAGDEAGDTSDKEGEGESSSSSREPHAEVGDGVAWDLTERE